MKVLISVDMEGIAGVVRSNHVWPDKKEYERFRKLMTAETNATIEGALAGGATRIVVTDSHGWKDNILIEELNPAAELVTGSPRPLGMMQGIGPEFGAAFFIGYHAASGTGAAVLAHTATSVVIEAHLNGQEVGETGLNAALAGAYGVPVTLITGDNAVVNEARTLLGQIETVETKESVTAAAARCLHPTVVQKHIRQAAERAMHIDVEPFVVPPPITLRVVFQQGIHADMAELIPGCRRVNGRTVEWTGEDMPAVYRVFRAMFSLCFYVVLLQRLY